MSRAIECSNIVVILGSHGEMANVRAILDELPSESGTAVCLHMSGAPCFPQDVDVRCELAPGWAWQVVQKDEPLLENRVYVAAPGRRMVISVDKSVGLAERGLGPGPDLILSSAQAFWSRSTIVILSGCAGAGLASLSLAKSLGAKVLVEDPKTADRACMPEAAIATRCVDFVLPVGRIGAKAASFLYADIFR